MVDSAPENRRPATCDYVVGIVAQMPNFGDPNRIAALNAAFSGCANFDGIAPAIASAYGRDAALQIVAQVGVIARTADAGDKLAKRAAVWAQEAPDVLQTWQPNVAPKKVEAKVITEQQVGVSGVQREPWSHQKTSYGVPKGPGRYRDRKVPKHY